VRIAAVALGAVWLGLAVAKTMDRSDLVRFLGAQHSGLSADVLAAAVIGLEYLFAAYFLLYPRWRRLTLAACSLALALALSAATLLLPERIRCGCLGTAASSDAARRVVVAACLLYLSAALLGEVNAAYPREAR
jgi:hypothetical protein